MTPMDEFAETDEWPVPERWARHQAETGLTPPAPSSPATDRVVWRDRGVRIAALQAEVEGLTREIFDRDATEVDARSRLTVTEAELAGLREGIKALADLVEREGWVDYGAIVGAMRNLLAPAPEAATGEATCAFDVGDSYVCRCLLPRGHGGMHQCKHSPAPVVAPSAEEEDER